MNESYFEADNDLVVLEVTKEMQTLANYAYTKQNVVAMERGRSIRRVKVRGGGCVGV